MSLPAIGYTSNWCSGCVIFASRAMIATFAARLAPALSPAITIRAESPFNVPAFSTTQT